MCIFLLNEGNKNDTVNHLLLIKFKIMQLDNYFGVHRFCLLPALSGEMGWLYSRDRRIINMKRFWNKN